MKDMSRAGLHDNAGERRDQAVVHDSPATATRVLRVQPPVECIEYCKAAGSHRTGQA